MTPEEEALAANITGPIQHVLLIRTRLLPPPEDRFNKRIQRILVAVKLTPKQKQPRDDIAKLIARSMQVLEFTIDPETRRWV